MPWQVSEPGPPLSRGPPPSLGGGGGGGGGGGVLPMQLLISLAQLVCRQLSQALPGLAPPHCVAQVPAKAELMHVATAL